ncbi:MAG: hypothetical protein ACP5N1_03845 [Candidatus Woesearchaeota archaeon]
MVEYLKAISECPDEYKLIGDRNSHKLLTDFFVDDNFAIYINQDYNQSVEFMKTLNDFKLDKELIKKVEPKLRFHYFNYNPGTVNGMITEWIHYPPRNIEDEIKSKYKSTIMLYTYQGKHLPGKILENVSEERVIATSLTTIANELIKNNVDFCFGPQKQCSVRQLSDLVHYTKI